MELIQKLNDLIEEEIDGAECYVRLANKYKGENQKLSETLNTIADQELKHTDMLHEEVMKAINDYKAKNGEPPAAMKSVYDYLHGRMVDRVAKIKKIQK